MASTSQKKTTKKTSGKSGSRTTAKKPQPRPIRREVGGVVCLVLALCVFVSYFGISAIFIDWLAVLIRACWAMATGCLDRRWCWRAAFCCSTMDGL